MRIHLIAVGTRMPAWVGAGYHEYVRRLPRECALQLTEIPLCKRKKTQSATQAREEEGRQMLTAIPGDTEVIALDVPGESWSTEILASRLEAWLASGRDVTLLAGGPDGLAGTCLDRADRVWSLSPLTFPHPLVRIVVAEQIYRAWTILSGHPYHRS